MPTDGRYRVLQEMNAAGVNFTWHELNGAHAFMRDEGSAGRYDGELALQCYMMSVNLFRRKLHDGCDRRRGTTRMQMRYAEHRTYSRGPCCALRLIPVPAVRRGTRVDVNERVSLFVFRFCVPQRRAGAVLPVRLWRHRDALEKSYHGGGAASKRRVLGAAG